MILIVKILVINTSDQFIIEIILVINLEIRCSV